VTAEEVFGALEVRDMMLFRGFCRSIRDNVGYAAEDHPFTEHTGQVLEVYAAYLADAYDAYFLHFFPF
jgi:hypothetical protein